MADILSSHETERQISCPYNSSHTLTAKRMQTHIIRCRRQHPNHESVICINNATHIIPKPEYAFHMETCQDRKNLDKLAYVPEDVDFDKYAAPEVDMEYTEVWDDKGTTYNPALYCETHPVLRTVTTLSASKRKEFRQSERHRLQDLRDAYKETPIASSGTRQPNNSFCAASTSSKYVDEKDPHQYETVMNEDDNKRMRTTNNNQMGPSSAWKKPDNMNTINSVDFPPLGTKRQHGGRGRGRK